ncbi:MAG TPA: SGNH/GDSL hydrolase family protein [Gemmatimonadales bacterium]|nr:SGNH/GDSL hydrolase family protein [Gemmatimonadales bacterium]
MSHGGDGMSRREFVEAAGGVVGMAMAPGALRAPRRRRPPPAGAVLLFQGDSITDCHRDRAVTGPNEPAALATGYPLLLASRLLSEHPDAGLRVFNRGVSGNTVPDLDARWQADTLDLTPNVLSILIGVNDIWHKLNGTFHGTVEQYESGYDALLARTRQALPGVRLVVLEPFALRTGAVTDAWFPEFDQRRAAAARVAGRAGATFIPLQAMFDRLAAQAPPPYWAADGVHPTVAGHGAIARAWLDGVRW